MQSPDSPKEYSKNLLKRGFSVANVIRNLSAVFNISLEDAERIVLASMDLDRLAPNRKKESQAE